MAPKTTQAARKRAVITSNVLFDEEFTDAVLRLTDPTVQTEDHVFEIFEAAGYEEVSPDAEPGEGALEVWDWEQARHLLGRWCPKISQYDRLSKSTRGALMAELNKAAFALGIVNLKVSSAGLSLVPAREDLCSAAFRAVLPFLDPTYGWPPRRLAKCQLNTCGRWFLRPNQSGTVAMYCSTKHSNLARVRRSRERGIT